MNSLQIKDLRNSLLDIMNEIHRVCEEHEIKYYIIGGTALGAIRHGGFIPWDTDIDIAMRREDYERFLTISASALSADFFCANYMNVEDWYHPHALVFYKKTLIHWNKEYYRNKKDCPVYVDIFPLDYAPDDEVKQVNQYKIIRRKIYLQSRRDCTLYQRNPFPERVIKRTVSTCLHVVPNKVFNASLDKAMKRYSRIPTSHLCSMASHYSYKKQYMPVKFYGDGKTYRFEGRGYRGPAMIDEYLTQLYGDYMKLPPEEKRTEYMDYIDYIDFNVNPVTIGGGDALGNLNYQVRVFFCCSCHCYDKAVA